MKIDVTGSIIRIADETDPDTKLYYGILNIKYGERFSEKQIGPFATREECVTITNKAVDVFMKHLDKFLEDKKESP